jgi:hypothetical protein
MTSTYTQAGKPPWEKNMKFRDAFMNKGLVVNDVVFGLIETLF